MSLNALSLPKTIDTSTSDIIADFFIPLLSNSVRYDRGVGFFSTSWVKIASQGLLELARNQGKARWIISPILEKADWNALYTGSQAQFDEKLYKSLERTINKLKEDLEEDTRSAFAWMVADGILDFRLAVPRSKLDNEFHAKFGIFTDTAGNKVAFNGSYNDSITGTRNYEIIDIYCSWDNSEAERIVHRAQSFERLWSNQDQNVRVFQIPEAAREEIIKLRLYDRPYSKPSWAARSSINIENKWRHQDEAVQIFLKHERGVLNMATGTGKTRTALKIIKNLFLLNEIDTILISADGNDLLSQWYSELLNIRKDIPGKKMRLYRHYKNHKETQEFMLRPRNAILLASRQQLPNALADIEPDLLHRTILIHDEVHRLGSQGNRNHLAGLSDSIRFRLGLSATPEREYDEEGNEFIEHHIGPVLFTFGLKSAIERKILSPFQYHPLYYNITNEDRDKISKVFSKKAFREADGNPMSDAELGIEISRVYKTSKAKLPIFQNFIKTHQNLLKRCIIFVETQEYGEYVLDIIHEIHSDFHTYYSGEDSATLQRFARGDLECLVTCHRLSEGIDIQSLNTVILFSSAKAQLETIQRIGRCLRTNPNDYQKVANIVDFIRVDSNSEELNTDEKRKLWLTDLSKVQPKE